MRIIITKIAMIVISIFAIIGIANAELTRNDAEDLVLNQILVNDIGKIDVYVANDVFSAQDSLQLPTKNLSCPFSQNWVFFVDDYVFANWEHPCRYIFVNVVNGEYQIVNETIFPSYMTDFEKISSIELPEPIELPSYPGGTIDYSEPNPHLYAVIINGGWNDDWNYIRYWNNMSAIYCTLTQIYGYMPENIYVHSTTGTPEHNHWSLNLDNDPDNIPDIEYPAYKDSIENTFQILADEMGPDDQLFLYITGHGGSTRNIYSYIQLWDLDGDGWVDVNERISSSELHDMLLPFDDCAEITVLMGQCYSGGFITDVINITGPNRVIHTACYAYERSIAEVWITGCRYNEFVYYWFAAARGCFPGDNPWEPGYPVNEFPFYLYFTSGPPHPDPYDPDINGDGFVQMEEAFDYADNFDTWSGIFDPDNYYNPKPPHNNQLENPLSYHNIGFEEDLLTLSGLCGNVLNTQTVSGNFLVCDTLTISPDVTLTFEIGSQLFLSDTAQIIVDSAATLIIEDACIIRGENLSNIIDVHGSIQIGDNVAFTAPEGKYWDGLYLFNRSGEVIMNNVTFERCKLYNESLSLDIINSHFTNSGIEQYGDVLTISETDFYNSRVCCDWKPHRSDPPMYTDINISWCNFSNYYDSNPVYIQGYNFYDLSNNTISQCNGGFKIYYSGNPKKCIIANNDIQNNPYGNGIVLYQSHADIIGSNRIRENTVGIIGAQNSSIKIIGNKDYPLQTIQNNIREEIVVDFKSFPEEIYYNKIIDDDYVEYTSDQYLIRCVNYTGDPRDLIVEDNYWGTASLEWIEWTGDDRFNPSDAFDYIPVWDPGTPRSPGSSSPEQLFSEADSLISAEEYEQAKLVYKDIIEIYPESKFALYSMRNLLPLETVSGKDFSSLQGYYLTDPNCNYNPVRTKLSEYLANYCNIKMENYPDAITFFEDIILNPDTELDSVYAVIDAGYTYLLMNNSGGKSYIGSIAELKPKSVEEFESIRDKLLAKVLGLTEQYEEEIIPETTFYLGQNYPNPINPDKIGTTTISFSIPKDAKNSEIKIYNIKGQLVKKFSIISDQSSIVWDGKDSNGKQLSNGIYLYKLDTGEKSITKKMVLLR